MGIGKKILMILLALCLLASLAFTTFNFGGPLSDDGWDLGRWLRNDGHLGLGVAVILAAGMIQLGKKKPATGTEA